MKRFILATAILAVLGGQTLGGAGHGPITLTGTVLLGNGEANIAQASAACNTSHPDNGLDGIWFAVSGIGGHQGLLTPGNTATEDFDVYFYGPGANGPCTNLGHAGMAQEFSGAACNATVSHPAWCSVFGDGIEDTLAAGVPAATTHVFVMYFLGPPNGTFTLTFS